MDDEAILALDLHYSLKEAGATVIGPATTLKRAMDLIDSESFDCALLDVQMGDQDGFAAAEKLRLAGIPWIFHTGNADPEALRRQWPSRPILVKPADPASLVAALLALNVMPAR